MLDCSQSFLTPIIDFNATIDFSLDLSKVLDFSSFKTGSYTLTMNNGPMIMYFNLVLKDGVTLYVNKKITGKGTIYIEDGATADARWSPLGVRVVSFKKGKLVF